MECLIYNARIVTAGEVITGSLLVNGDRIMYIDGVAADPNTDSLSPSAQLIDADGCYVIPGLIDVHGDMHERFIQPRKGVQVPIPLALHALQSSLLSAGITTMFHGIAFVGEPGLRSNQSAYEIARQLVRLNRDPQRALLRHRLHLRYELVNDKDVELLHRMIDDGWVDLFSLMDHSPQHGKYETLDAFRYYVEKSYSLSEEEREAYIRRKWSERQQVDEQVSRELIRRVLERGIPMASHDDYSPQQLSAMKELGAVISEFPLNVETAACANQLGLAVVVGGPNLLRGHSHEDKLSAQEAVWKGLADIVCSDYYPHSMLPAVFKLHQEGMALPQAISYVTSAPARATGMDRELGSLEPGKLADLVIVRQDEAGMPMVMAVMVNGAWSYRSKAANAYE